MPSFVLMPLGDDSLALEAREFHPKKRQRAFTYSLKGKVSAPLKILCLWARKCTLGLELHDGTHGLFQPESGKNCGL